MTCTYWLTADVGCAGVEQLFRAGADRRDPLRRDPRTYGPARRGSSRPCAGPGSHCPRAWFSRFPFASAEKIDHLFLAGFFAGDGALVAGAPVGCALCSGTFATVKIWICWLAADVGCAGSSNCSSPSPIVWIRFVEILKVLTRMSRIASALRWLRITLPSRLPLASIWPTIRKL